ncbi:MAG: class I SAM-dependent DNA methyltransferase [Bacillota bacterium]|nr:class I SAM-dependent DNA methyltransferase [Bacillota bacterium]
MNSSDLSRRTTVNVQEKANLIWAIADKLVGPYKPHEYGLVVLPMCVIKRFNDALLPTREAVLLKNAELTDLRIQVKEGFLTQASGYKFYNTSPFTLQTLLADPDNIEANFRSYLAAFSENVIDIIEKFDFDKEITKMANNSLLFNVIAEFCTARADMSPDKVSSADMGYIFEELVRRFSESYDEHAGAHFTARDVIYLMTDLLIHPRREAIKQGGMAATVYDMAMGTSQMLACMEERIKAIDPDADVLSFGQEINEQTYAIAKADMLIKGGNPDNMRHGNTLSDDQFGGFQFDFIISNPPFGIEWKNERAAVNREHAKGREGRFPPGLPAISDSQQLFLLNGLAKLRPEGRMAIIQNGSPLFTGDAGSGPSEIRGYLLENDWLEAIVQMPNDLFYNTGIATYIWLVTKNKAPERAGKVQLIDASKCFVKRRKSLGNKRNELDDVCIALVLKAYAAKKDVLLEENGLLVESKLFANEAFKYSKLTVERPLLNENGLPVLKRGKPQPDSALRDTEILPWGTDEDAYIKENVLPYAPDAWVDHSKTKIGYEIPFTRYFYKFTPPRPSQEILARLKELQAETDALIKGWQA